MLVGVISDTHDSLGLIKRASSRFNELGVNVVIHLGDYVAPFSLRLLGDEVKAGKIIGVLGNNDGEKLGLYLAARERGIELGEAPRTLVLGGKRLLLLHGYGSPDTTLELVRALAKSGAWDAVLFGHTHEPLKEYISGTLLLNPGDGGGVLNRPSIATINMEKMEAEIIWL